MAILPALSPWEPPREELSWASQAIRRWDSIQVLVCSPGFGHCGRFSKRPALQGDCTLKFKIDISLVPEEDPVEGWNMLYK